MGWCTRLLRLRVQPEAQPKLHIAIGFLQPGDALLLPAYWYHQVESDAQSGSLNVAINYWFTSGSLPERLHGLMRKRLLVQNGCTGLSMYARR